MSWVCGFVATGDSGEGEEPTRGEMVKQSDETYLIWCSGRVHCSGLLVHMQVCGGEGLQWKRSYGKWGS